MRSIFLHAICQKNSKVLIRLLKKLTPETILETDAEGANIAHYLAGSGMLEGLKYLENNPRTEILLTQADNNNTRPFITAVLNNQKIIVKYFIENQYDEFASAGHSAAFFGDLKSIKTLHAEHQLDKKDSLNVDALGYAVASGQIEIVEFLIENNYLKEHLDHSGLFSIAVDMQHFSIAKVLLKKIHYFNFIKSIPKLVKILAKKNSTVIEIIEQLEVDKLRPPEGFTNHYPYFLANAIIQDSLEIFTYFIQKLLKDNSYPSPLPRTLKNLCDLISEYKRWRFAEPLAKEIYNLSKASFFSSKNNEKNDSKENFSSTAEPKNFMFENLASQCCRYFIELNDGIALEILLKTFQKTDPVLIDKLTKSNHEGNCFYHTLKNGNLDLIPILRNYFGDLYFRKNAGFFTSTEEFETFSQIYLPIKNDDSVIHSLEYSRFIEAVYNTISMPKNALDHYKCVSKKLFTCSQMNSAHTAFFTENSIYFLYTILETYAKAEELNWPLLNEVFLDMKYFIFHPLLPVNANQLDRFLKLAFVFSDYHAINELINAFLEKKYHKTISLLPLQIMTFFIQKLCAEFFLDVEFYPSNDEKRLLLQEHIETKDFYLKSIGGISLLAILSKITLTPEKITLFSKKISEIPLESIKIQIHESTTKQENLNKIFEDIASVYDQLRQLKEYAEAINTKITWVTHADYQDNLQSISLNETTALKLEKSDLYMLQCHKNVYELKIFIFNFILELSKKLQIIKEKFSELIVDKLQKNTSSKTFKKSPIADEIKDIKLGTVFTKDFTKIAFYQVSVINAKENLAKLSSAFLIAEENVEQKERQPYTKKIQKKAKKKQKKSEKKVPAIASSIRKNSHIASNLPITTYLHGVQIDIEHNEENAWQQQKSRKNVTTYVCHFEKHDKSRSNHEIADNTSIANVKKASINTKLAKALQDHNVGPTKQIPEKNTPTIKRQWEPLKAFLYKKHDKNIVILENSILNAWGFYIDIPKAVQDFFNFFAKNELFLVGGAIRNALMRVPIKDFDFIAFSSLEKIKKMFPGCGIKGKGKKVIAAIDYRGHCFEVLPIETENSSYKAVLLEKNLDAKMLLSLLKQDSLQRDFSINSLYWNPMLGIIDVCNGMKDLLFHRIISPIQSGSKHFEMHHAIRIFRAIRFAAQFHLNISVKLRTTMIKNASFLYTVNEIKLRKEHENLVLAVGKTQAYQLYCTYFLYNLVANRQIFSSKPSWNNFWETNIHVNSQENRHHDLTHVGKNIENCLDKKALRAFACTNKNYFMLFKSQEKVLKQTFMNAAADSGKFISQQTNSIDRAFF